MNLAASNYVFASSRAWNIETFFRHRSKLPGHWTVVTIPQDLEAAIASLQPRYVFFPHWSDIVPQKVLDTVECVCFHMADVPYGRGGSPLQNLIVRGHTETVLTALRMTSELDAGPVYLKRPLALDGTAMDIFQRASELALSMIDEITRMTPVPTAQEGEVVEFKRRSPKDSLLPAADDSKTLYDHIRMLDAAGYPAAFVEHEGWHIEFTDGALSGGDLVSKAIFKKKDAHDG